MTPRRTSGWWARAVLGLAAAALMPGAGAAESPFQVSLRLLRPVTLSQSEGLRFPALTAGGAGAVTVSPAEGARFTGAGEPGAVVTGSVVQDAIQLARAGGGASIRVDDFTLGGDMDSAGNARFDAGGALSALRVGATAHVQADHPVGAYAGAATFRLLYQ